MKLRCLARLMSSARDGLKEAFVDLGEKALKNITRPV
jgi:hypothetical protein